MDNGMNEKPPILVEEFVISLRGGLTHIGLFTRVAPHGASCAADETTTCVGRIVLSEASADLLIEGLEQAREITVLKRPLLCQ